MQLSVEQSCRELAGKSVSLVDRWHWQVLPRRVLDTGGAMERIEWKYACNILRDL